MMRVHVVGNAAFDETVAVAAWPVPGESILGRAVASGPGGKGLNQAVALARAGVPTRLVAGIAADVRGAAIRQALAGEPLSADLVEMPDRATDTSIVLSAPDGDNCNITTTGCADALGPAAVEAALASANPEDVLLVQGNLGKAATRAALVMAGRRGMLRVMNPSPLRPWQADLLPECEMIFVNAAEAAFLTACPQERAAEALRDVGVGTVIITLGAAGATASGPEEVVTVAAAPARVVDTTGAGDAFLGATLGSSLLRGARIDLRALEAGAQAAALTVARPGAFAALPTVAELDRIMRR